jgi:hypothetical protein
MKAVISRSRVTLIKTEENNLKLDDDFGKLWNQVYVWSRHDGKEDSIKLPTIDTNFCPYKVEYNSNEDDVDSQHQMKSRNWAHAVMIRTARWYLLSKGRTNHHQSWP